MAAHHPKMLKHPALILELISKIVYFKKEFILAPLVHLNPF